MARNTAAQELAALTASTREAEERAANLAAQDRERGLSGADRRTSEPEEASFALPEALATAVGAGWILGPAGGIALGIAQGIIGKREKQSLLDQFAAEQDAVQNVKDTLDGQFDELLADAQNPDDVDQLNAYRAQQDAAFKMLMSGSPAMQEKGAEMLAAVQAEVNGYTERQETQRLEQEAIDAQLKRELDQEQYTRFTALQDDFQTESQPYEDVQGAVNVAYEALERGTPADLHAALVLVNQALDPNSVARESEVQAFARMGNLFEKTGAIIQQHLGSGQQATPEMRRDLIQLLSTIENNNRQMQLAREARYTTELDIAGLDNPKYREPFRRVSSVPAYQRQGLQNAGGPGQTVQDTASEATAGAQEAAEGLQEQAGGVLDYLRGRTTDLFEGVADWYSGSGRERRRERLQELRRRQTNE